MRKNSKDKTFYYAALKQTKRKREREREREREVL
jgi:hypothetical protein